MTTQTLAKGTVLLFLIAVATGYTQTSKVIIRNGETLAFLGDSITAAGAGYGGYCRLVIQGLKAKGIRAKGVFAGVPGNTSADMLLRLDRAVLDHKPDHVFLLAGVNDIWHHDPTVKIGVYQAKPGMGVGLEHYKLYMTQIVDRCQNAGAKVILSTITPITEDPAFKLNKTSEKYNAFLRSLAKERKLPIAELNKAMFAKIAELKAKSQEPGSRPKRNVATSDGVHPIPVGHQTMAKGILKTMGFTDDELTQVQKEWDESPQILIAGERQVASGGRTGGWCHLLMDGMNAGREMVTYKTVTAKRITMVPLVARVEREIVMGRTKHVLLVPPWGDIEKSTSQADYKAAVLSLIEIVRKKGAKLIISTLPIPDPKGTVEPKSIMYNTLLRNICKEKKVPLADINACMSAYYKKNPGTRLNLGDQRFNHTGGTLMAETVLRTLGYDDKLIAQAKELWDERNSYTFLGAYRRKFDVRLSEDGYDTLQRIVRRYHMLSTPHLVQHGIYLLLKGNSERNKQALYCFDKEWLATKKDDKAKVHNIYIKLMPSPKEGRVLRSYLKEERIDLQTLYLRAFKVGVWCLAVEDPLGRGKN